MDRLRRYKQKHKNEEVTDPPPALLTRPDGAHAHTHYILQSAMAQEPAAAHLEFGGPEGLQLTDVQWLPRALLG